MMPTMTLRTRRLIASVLFCALVVGVLTLASVVLKPARKGDSGGSTWPAYLSTERDSLDVVFFGTSHVFSGVDPGTIWRSRGIASYVLGGPTQSMSVTYYYLREALKTQRPKVVALEMTGVSYRAGTYNREFQQINVGYMPFSENKLGAALFATPEGERTGVLVDLWTYHSRWTQLGREDWDIFGKDRDFEYLKGYLPKTASREVTPTPYEPVGSARDDADAAVAHNLPDLRRIAQLCAEENIELLLFLTPTGPPGAYSYPMREAADAIQTEYPDVRVLDLSEPGAVPGLSFETDFFDGGHLSDSGARKVAPVLADYLAETYGLPDHRSDPAYAAWDHDAHKRDDYVARRTGK